MEMKLPKVITPVIEELWYLIHNTKFQEGIRKIRLKYNIAEDGSNSFQAFDALWKDKGSFSPKKYQELKKDILNLLSKCRMAKSKYESDFLFSLENYLFTNTLMPFSDKFLLTPYPDLKLRQTSNRIELIIDLEFDTTIAQIKEIVEMNKRKIKGLQRSLGGTKLKSSNFKLNTEIWLKYKEEGYKLTKAVFQMQPNKSEKDIRELIRTMSNRITQSHI